MGLFSLELPRTLLLVEKLVKDQKLLIYLLIPRPLSLDLPTSVSTSRSTLASGSSPDFSLALRLLLHLGDLCRLSLPYGVIKRLLILRAVDSNTCTSLLTALSRAAITMTAPFLLSLLMLVVTFVAFDSPLATQVCLATSHLLGRQSVDLEIVTCVATELFFEVWVHFLRPRAPTV